MLSPDMQKFLDSYLQENYFTLWLKPEILELEEGYAKARLPFRRDLQNPMGLVHGGVLYALGDLLVGLVCRASGRACITLDGNINYLANIREGAVVASTHKLHQGRRTAVYRVSLCSEEGRLLAEARYTMQFLEKLDTSEQQRSFSSKPSQPQKGAET